MNYYEQEAESVKKLFNLDEILHFQLVHDVQIIRCEDYQYGCWINKKMYGTALTTLGALVFGIKIFKKRQHENNL